MDSGGQLQQMIVDRATGYFLMVWIVAAICTGLAASETKKRRFWIWFVLSILTGPIAWYLLFKWPKPIPAELAVACPHCRRTTRSDEKRCMHCRRLLVPAAKDRAAQIGETAATALFTAKRLFGSARKAAEEQQRRRAQARQAAEEPPRRRRTPPATSSQAETPER